MVITLTDVGAKKGDADDIIFYFPVTPSEISYRTATHFQEYNIINKGPAKVPSGQDISYIGWDCFFPGDNIKNMPFVNVTGITKKNSTKKKTAKQYNTQLESWRNKGTKLELNITGTPFRFNVYIDEYEAKYQDAHGSIYYTIEFSKAVDISVTTVKKKATKKNKTTGTKRTTKKATQKKHTIKKGDTLWSISKKYLKAGNKWKTIYNANKSTIEKAAKKHGKKSSSNGKWIYPGTVLKIPS